MSTTVSIIGTSGRTVPTGFKLSKALFEKMVTATEQLIQRLHPNDLANVHLVSGGAALSDHVAVALYLTGRYQGLTLYLPCAFDLKTCAYLNTGESDWRVNPGKVANYYFNWFNQIMGRNMQEDIKLAVTKGAQLDIGVGFHSRNAQVAQSREVIALTWGDTEPTDGGTLDTWKKVPKTSMRFHIGLKTLVKDF